MCKTSQRHGHFRSFLFSSIPQCELRHYYLPETALGSGDGTVNKASTRPPELTFESEEAEHTEEVQRKQHCCSIAIEWN